MGKIEMTRSVIGISVALVKLTPSRIEMYVTMPNISHNPSRFSAKANFIKEKLFSETRNLSNARQD